MDFIVAQGWNVLALGETCVEEFGGSDILTSASDVDLDDELLELYALTEARFVLSQHSGPPILADCSGVPVLLCDSMPYWQGRFSQRALMLLKQAFSKDRRLSYKEIYNNDELVNGFPQEDILILPNTESQILAAVKEMFQIVNNPIGIDHGFQIVRDGNAKYFDLLQPTALNYYLRTPIPEFELQNLK